MEGTHVEALNLIIKAMDVPVTHAMNEELALPSFY